MSQILVTRCANPDCDESLTEYEMQRQNFRIPKYHFCIKCRRKVRDISRIKCRRCDQPCIFTGQNTTCRDCVREKIRETNRNRTPKPRRIKNCVRCGNVLPKYKQKYCSYGCMGESNWNSPERKERLKERYN